MARRIVVFPVMGRRWAFSAVLPTGSDGKSLPVGSLNNLWESLRSTPQNSDRIELLTSYISDKMHEKFTSWEATPAGSIRNGLHRIGQRMLSRLGPTESFLKAIPKDTGLVEIVYPHSVNSRLVRRRVRHLATRESSLLMFTGGYVTKDHWEIADHGEIVHRRYMYGSIALLPFSMILGLLPLPNVVLAWNLFRAYSHWRAVQGSKRLSYLVTEPVPASDATSTEKQGEQSNASTSDHTADIKVNSNESNHWVPVPSEKLESLLNPANVLGEPITDVTVEEICKVYPLNPNEILKWRDQKLPIKSFG